MTQILQNSIDDLLYPKKLDRVHPYPAKFTIDLAMQYIKKYSRENEIVLDPFCGSGTTLLASRILKRQSIGLDINFIAILISQFKLLNLSKKDLQQLENFSINPFYQATKLYSYDNINHWFKQESIKALSSIREQIYNYAQGNEKYMIFLQLVFSSIINIASNQDSDTRYASIEKPYIDEKYIFAKFNEKFKNALEIYKNIPNEYLEQSQVFLHNAKQLTQKISKNSISLIFTSPPYPNTYDYYLYHKHRMLWLGCDVKFSMNNEIGSRREYSSLKLPKEKFNNDLLEIFTQCNKVLKQNGIIGIVMGDGKIAGNIYNAKDEILEIATKLQWDLIGYSFNDLDKTSRSFAQSYRTKNKKEHILVFARNGDAN